MDNDFKEYFNYAKEIAYKLVKDYELAEEIASNCVVKLEKVSRTREIANPKGWIRKVVTNLCNDYFNKQKRLLEVPLEEEKLEYFAYKNQENSSEIIDFEIDFSKYPFLEHKDREKKILEYFYIEKESNAKIAQRFKIKESKIKEIIYKFTNEIELYHLIDNKTLFFKLLPYTNLTLKINNFIHKLKNSLINNDLSSMKRYLKNAKINDFSKIKFKEMKSCKLEYIDENNYRLLVVLINQANKYSFFFIEFIITSSNNIQVVEFPIWPQGVLQIDKSKLKTEIKQKDLDSFKGSYNERLGSYDELKKKGIAKEIQQKDKF
jgi:RNA polymerase sigma factor (sigma-70 family)